MTRTCALKGAGSESRWNFAPEVRAGMFCTGKKSEILFWSWSQQQLRDVALEGLSAVKGRQRALLPGVL